MLYELLPDANGRSGRKHAQSRKRYILDMMIWSSAGDNAAAVEANLRSRYQLLGQYDQYDSGKK